MGIRSQIQKKNRFVSQDRGIDKRRFALICVVSCAVHLLFFLGIFGLHQFDFQKPRPRVVTVDLVSFVPGSSGGAPEPEVVRKKTAPAKKPDVNLNTKSPAPKQTEPAPAPVLKPDISLKTKPKNIKELMAAREKKEQPPKPEPKTPKPKAKPKPDSEKELKKARQAMAEKVEQQKQEQINQALERMKAAISGKKSQGGQVPGQGPGGGRNVSDPEKLYQMVLASTIRQNWVFNDTLARLDKNLECRVLVKILKDGEIKDIIFETRSGNQYLDASVKKAILRSNPLPELPMGWTSYDIGFVFSPKGLK
jgi:outer membrane biosynthesis protein TonB